VLLPNYSIVVDRRAQQQCLVVDIMAVDPGMLYLVIENQWVVEDIANKLVVNCSALKKKNNYLSKIPKFSVKYITYG
jgi:hypothetical protein